MSESNQIFGHERITLDPIPEPVITSPYRESEDHVPDPTAVTGTLETSGVGSGSHSRLEGVSAVFGSPLAQPTVERDGLAEHEAVTDPETEPEQEAEQAPESESEGGPEVEREESPAPDSTEKTEDTPEDDKADEQAAKAPVRKTAKKAASAPDTTKK